MAIGIISADGIGGANGDFEVQRVNNALLYIVGIGATSAPGQESNDDVLALALQQFPLPKVTSGIIEHGYINEKRKFAGNPTYDDLSVVYVDTVDTGVAKTLWEWRLQVHDPVTGKTGLAKNYKKKGWVTMFDPSGEQEREYELVGVWPSAMDPGDIDLAGEDSVKITMTLTIDKAVPRTNLHPKADQQAFGASAATA